MLHREHYAEVAGGSGTALYSAMSLPEHSSSQPRYPHLSTPALSDAEVAEQLLQHSAQAAQRGGHSPVISQTSEGKSPPEGPSSGADTRRESEAHVWMDRGRTASGLGPDERRDREDTETRYAPINNAPTQGQICRYVFEL